MNSSQAKRHRSQGNPDSMSEIGGGSAKEYFAHDSTSTHDGILYAIVSRLSTCRDHLSSSNEFF
jgi:hypothetical protein